MKRKRGYGDDIKDKEYLAQIQPILANAKKKQRELAWKQHLKSLQTPYTSIKANKDTQAFGHKFYKQSTAIAYACQRNAGGLKSGDIEEEWTVFAQETKSAKRIYVASTRAAFWRFYNVLPEWRKVHYELIMQDHPARLYFDLEFYTRHNEGLDAEAVQATFMKILASSLLEVYDIDMSEEQVIVLDSTRKEKWSQHVILPNVVFEDNIVMGYYVRSLVEYAKHRSGEDFSILFVNTEDISHKTCVIDQGVYTRNRNMRLYKSHKRNAKHSLIYHMSSTYAVKSEKQLFFDSLVTATTKTENLLTSENASPTTYSHSYAPSQTSNMPSPHTMIDKYLSDYLISERPGRAGYLRTWRISGNRLTYYVENNRYCERIGREHKSNHVLFVVELSKGVFWQECLDSECSGFKGTTLPLPVDICNKLGLSRSQFQESQFLNDAALLSAIEENPALFP